MITFLIDEDLPRSTKDELNQELTKNLSRLKDTELYGNLLIIEPGRVRIHRVSAK